MTCVASVATLPHCRHLHPAVQSVLPADPVMRCQSLLLGWLPCLASKSQLQSMKDLAVGKFADGFCVCTSGAWELRGMRRREAQVATAGERAQVSV